MHSTQQMLGTCGFVTNALRSSTAGSCCTRCELAGWHPSGWMHTMRWPLMAAAAAFSS